MFKYAIVAFLAFIVNASSKNIDPVCIQGPKPGVNAAACCRVPNLLPEPILEKCASSVPSTHQPPGVCITECIFNETGLLQDRQFQMEVAKTNFADILQEDEEWVELAVEALNTCSEKITSKLMARLTQAKEGECSKLSTFYIGCVITELFKNCPPSKWTENGACAELKQNAEKCVVLNSLLIA